MKSSAIIKFAGFSLWLLAAAPAAAQSVCNDVTDGYLLDWNQETYAQGSTSFSTNVIRDGAAPGDSDAESVGVSVTFSGATNRILGGFPQNTNFFQGGNGATANSLAVAADFAQMNEVLDLTITFDREVDNLTFDIFDIDFLAANNGTGGFRDSVTITGFRANGSTVLPVLTTPFNGGPQGQVAPSTVYVGAPIASNRAVGNHSNGNGNSANGQNLGNVIVTFSDEVERVEIDYETRSDFFTTNNPQAQGMGLYDLDFCVPRTASLDFDKQVRLHAESPVDCGLIPGTPDPAASAAIPGSCLQYDITVENDGSGSSTGTDIVDQLNSNMIFAGASFSGFDTSDPDFAFDLPAPLTDCGVATCEIAIRDGILASGAQGTITIRTILK